MKSGLKCSLQKKKENAVAIDGVTEHKYNELLSR